MRRFYLAPVMTILMLGLPCWPAYAVGNVLVPSDSDSDTSVLPGASPGPPPSSVQMPPKKISPATRDTLPVPLKVPPNPAALRYTPVPASVTPMPTAIESKPPTQIVKMAAVELADDPSDTTRPNSLNVSMQDYLWGSQDTALVNRSLSIPADQVPKYCRLSVFGTLISDTGGYMFDIGLSRPQGVLRYGGKPSSINVMARAMCDTVPLPPNSGTVQQIGDKYVVYITQTQCPLPPSGARNLVFKYVGNGNGQCVYQ